MSDRLHVALIDDDAAVLDALHYYLARQTIRTSTFQAAEKNSEALDRHEQFDCVLSDVRMPGMSGLDLMKHLNERGYAGPVILITGHGDSTWRSAPSRAARSISSRSPSMRPVCLTSIRQEAERSAPDQKRGGRDRRTANALRQPFGAATRGNGARCRRAFKQGDRDQAQHQPEDCRKSSRLGDGAHRRPQRRGPDPKGHENPIPQGTPEVMS